MNEFITQKVDIAVGTRAATGGLRGPLEVQHIWTNCAVSNWMGLLNWPTADGGEALCVRIPLLHPLVFSHDHTRFLM